MVCLTSGSFWSQSSRYSLWGYNCLDIGIHYESVSDDVTVSLHASTSVQLLLDLLVDHPLRLIPSLVAKHALRWCPYAPECTPSPRALPNKVIRLMPRPGVLPLLRVLQLVLEIAAVQ